jgi:hypothetical protein
VSRIFSLPDPLGQDGRRQSTGARKPTKSNFVLSKFRDSTCVSIGI